MNTFDRLALTALLALSVCFLDDYFQGGRINIWAWGVTWTGGAIAAWINKS